MNTHTPYRARYNNQGDVCIEGDNFFQQYKSSLKFDIYAPNLDPVPQPCDSGQSPVPGGCGTRGTALATDAGYNWSSAFCPGLGLPGEYWQSESSGFVAGGYGVTTDMLALQNTAFTKGAKVDLGECHNYAFKIYGATKFWHGNPGYIRISEYALTNSGKVTGVAFTAGLLSAGAGFGALTYAAIDPSPSQVKYLREKWDISPCNFSNKDDSGSIVDSESSSLTAQADVNPTSGEITLTGIAFTDEGFFSVDFGGPLPSPILSTPGGGGGGGLAAVWNGMTGNILGFCASANFNSMAGFFASFEHLSYAKNYPTASVLNPSAGVYELHYPMGGADTVMETVTLDFSAGTFSRVVNYDGIQFSQACTATDTSIIFDVLTSAFTSDERYPLAIASNTFHFEKTLSVPYNFSGTGSLESDLVSLNSLWSLNGPEKWRTDSFGGLMPLVCRREVQADVNPSPVMLAALQTLPQYSSWPDGQPYSYSDTELLVPDMANPISDFLGRAPFTTNYTETPVPGWTVIPVGQWSPTYGTTGWFDPAVYAWVYPTGTVNGWAGVPNAAATGLQKLMDGAIIGGPNPSSAGAYGWFDFYYRDRHFCQQVDGVGGSVDVYDYYNYGFGGNLAEVSVSLPGPNGSSSGPAISGPTFDALLPSNATHWTGNLIAMDVPLGAIIDCGCPSGANGTVRGANGAVTMVKYARVRLPVPSYNFARPCGGDRTLIDEGSAQCFTAGLILNAPLPDGGTFPVLSTQQVLLWGTGSDGIYTGCTQATVAGVTTLTIAGATKIADLPTDYYHPFCGLDGGTSANHFAAGFAGIVRFSGLNGSKAAAALCGRQQFTMQAIGLPASGTTQITFLAAQTNLRTADTLDFAQADMTALVTPQTNIAVTRLTGGSYATDKDFSIPVPFNSMTGAIWATSSGATVPAWYWNDDSQKMQGRYGGWTNDNRNLTGGNPTVVFDGGSPCGEEFSPCCPQVIAFTPNNDTDAGWVKEWFGSVTADNVFGSRATLGAEWEMTDPMSQGWLRPIPTNVADSEGDTHTTTAFVFLEDDGTSQPDRLDSSSDESGNTTNVWTLYFQPHSRVEALFAVPDGSGGNGTGMTRTEPAPALPVDSLGQAVVWPVMQQPASPGDWTTRDAATGYELVLDPGQRYANELAAGSTARFARWYLALTLGGGW